MPPDRLFPTHRDAGSGPQDDVDLPQERHLREFGRFLAPRWGFFEVETWTALVAVISGLLPALAIALAILGVLLTGWLTLTFPLAYRSRLAPLPVVLLITGVTLYVFEKMWHGVKSASAGHIGVTDVATAQQPVRRAASRYVMVASAALGLVAALQFFLPSAYAAVTSNVLPTLSAGGWRDAPGDGAFDQWWAVVGIANQSGTWFFSPRLFDYAAVWLAASLIMVACRVVRPVALHRRP